MNLSDLRPPVGQKHTKRRVGRGMGSGRGKTAGRGHKGQHSVSGSSLMRGFEGGQMPLHRRLPKFGFTNINRVEYLPVNLYRLEELVTKGKVTDGAITPEALYEHGVVAKKSAPIKILGTGEVKSPLNITVHACSASARKKIEAAGGTVTLLTA